MVKLIGLVDPPRVIHGNFALLLPPVGPSHSLPPPDADICQGVDSHLARRVIGSAMKEYHKILLRSEPTPLPLGTNISHRDQLDSGF